MVVLWKLVMEESLDSLVGNLDVNILVCVTTKRL
jgi:hypothetical protein